LVTTSTCFKSRQCPIALGFQGAGNPNCCPSPTASCAVQLGSGQGNTSTEGSLGAGSNHTTVHDVTSRDLCMTHIRKLATCACNRVKLTAGILQSSRL
jgi:hypothetical protein